MEHLSFFNKIISEILAVDVKIDEENKALILLSSFLQSYDHIVIWLEKCEVNFLLIAKKITTDTI